jgi:hypothetical protein
MFSYIGGQRAAHRSHVDRPPAGPGIPPDYEDPAGTTTTDLE